MKILREKDIEYAAKLLENDKLVVIPTETVYGLGANAFSEKAVQKIFNVKNRPMDNPLIIHVAGAEDLEKYCKDVPQEAYLMAQHFWPGPLTMILKRKSLVPDFVTAGLDTVAVRCPDSKLTQELLRKVEFPIAAPSANLSGRPSTTTITHVLEDLDGKVPAVLDGGDCRIGLESTIVDLSSDAPALLRPGGVTLDQLEEYLGTVEVDPCLTKKMKNDEKPKAPGMKYRHYAPKADVVVIQGNPDDTARYIQKHVVAGQGVLCFEEYKKSFGDHVIVYTMGSKGDLSAQAHFLFDRLRCFDKHKNVKRIYAQSCTLEGLGMAVSNRLNKASGFCIVNV